MSKRTHLFAALIGAMVGAASPAAAADAVQLSDLGACGQRVETFKSCEKCAAQSVFAPAGAWHELAQCFKQLRTQWSRKGPLAPVDLPGKPTITDLTRAQVLKEMTSPRVGFRTQGSDGKAFQRFQDVFDDQLRPKAPVETAALLNDVGQPYNSMGQTGVAYFLYNFVILSAKGGYDAAAADQAFYLTLARAAARTVLTPTQAGGLATEGPCEAGGTEQCAWYHSVTRRDLQAAAGGTLNQMLHALRDLGQMADLTVETDASIRDGYDAAITAGLNQLARGKGHAAPGESPNLKDFLYPADPALPGRWAYYGLNVEASPSRAPYLLNAAGKNCSYQAHVLELFQQVLSREQKRAPKSDIGRDWLSCGSPLIDFYVAAKSGSQPNATARNPDLSCPLDTGKALARLDGFYAAAAGQCRR